MNNDLISRKALLEILRHLDDEPEDINSEEYFEWDNMSAYEMLDKVLNIVRTFPTADREVYTSPIWSRNREKR